MRPLAEFGAALTLLTRLPGGRLVRGDWPAPAACVWAYPVVGLIVGGIGGSVLWMLERAGVPPLPAATVAMAAAMLATGGLHEDGLADCADALGGRTLEARLAIMRDSRIGAHGAAALGIALLVRAGTLSSLDPGRATLALMAASAVGRGAMLVAMAVARPARPDGLGASVAGGGRGRNLVGLALAFGIAAGLARHWPGCLVIGLGAGWAVGAGARRGFGGYTGDVLGAAAVLGECGVLLVEARA